MSTREEIFNPLKKIVMTEKVKFGALGSVAVFCVIKCILYTFNIGYYNGTMDTINDVFVLDEDDGQLEVLRERHKEKFEEKLKDYKKRKKFNKMYNIY